MISLLPLLPAIVVKLAVGGKLEEVGFPLTILELGRLIILLPLLLAIELKAFSFDSETAAPLIAVALVPS